jgi:hypothetical protein
MTMEIKRVPISELQPSDTPRDSTICYYNSLGDGLNKLERLPQVWETDEGLLISDGNNYVVFQAYKGVDEIEVEYQSRSSLDQFSHIFADGVDRLLEDVQILKGLGVTSPYDLVDLVDLENQEAA